MSVDAYHALLRLLELDLRLALFRRRRLRIRRRRRRRRRLGLPPRRHTRHQQPLAVPRALKLLQARRQRLGALLLNVQAPRQREFGGGGAPLRRYLLHLLDVAPQVYIESEI